MVKKKACIFISGNGTNLKSIIINSRDPNFPIKISLVLTNNKNAGGIHYAKKFLIPFRIINFRKKKFERIALKEMVEKKIKLICLAGFMKILSKKFVRDFNGKIINIHPSLLPKYKGLNTFKRVLKNKERYTGCTVHVVDEKLDNGRVILKKRVEIYQGEEENILKKRVQNEEHKLYSMAIRKVYNPL
tara:strand:+ start:1133 stop:1696 length:564 start_codon:yes stop_codon:yes gene_type:complete